MRRATKRTATACAFLLACFGCKEITGDPGEPGGGDLPPSGDLSDTVTVVIENFAFRTPNGTDSITINGGQVVRFVNRDAAPHTATSTEGPTGDAGFDTGRLDQGDAYHWEPPSTGEWIYRCDFHPADMSGAVIRVGGAAPPDTLTDGGASADTIQVDIVNFSFRGPDGSSDLQVELGQTVRFVNRDDADHTVTSTAAPAGGAFDSGNLDEGQVFYWTPGRTGSWGYQCEYHPEMAGAIAVSDPGADDPGGDDPDDDQPSGTVSIAITDSGFVGPDGTGHVTLALGETVQWVNEGARVHTASATDAPDGGQRFDSGDLSPGASFSFTPDRRGVWTYRCDEHSDEPEGTVTVE